MFKFHKKKKKERFFVKENKESIEIFRNIWIFNMESPHLINYLTNMCWSCPSQKWWDPHEQNRQVWSKTNVREHYPAYNDLGKAGNYERQFLAIWTWNMWDHFAKWNACPQRLLGLCSKKNPYGMVNPKKLGYG
jgi:hypothetical protein